MANRPINIVVMRDIENNVTIFDRGYLRRTYSSLRMNGYGKEIANSYTVALANICITTRKRSKSGLTYLVVSDNEVIEFLEKNKDDVLFTYTLCAKKNNDSTKSKRIPAHSASIMGAVFEAIQDGEDKSIIKTFIEVFRTGFYDNNEQTAAIVLRNDFLSNSIVTSGTPQRVKAMYCVEKAIQDFCSGKPRKITYANWEDPVYTKYMEVKQK